MTFTLDQFIAAGFLGVIVGIVLALAVVLWVGGKLSMRPRRVEVLDIPITVDPTGEEYDVSCMMAVYSDERLNVRGGVA